MSKLEDIKKRIESLNSMPNLKEKIISMKEIKEEIDFEQKKI